MDGEVLGNQAYTMMTPKTSKFGFSPNQIGAFLCVEFDLSEPCQKENGFYDRWKS